MLDRSRIPAVQLFCLLGLALFVNGPIYIPTATSMIAGRDAVFAPWVMLAGGVPVLALYAALQRRHPHTDLLTISRSACGRVVGTTAFAVLLLWWTYLGALTLRQMTEVFLLILPATPPVAILTPLLLVSAYAVRGGVEVIGRAAVVLMAVAGALFNSILLMAVPVMAWERLFPLLERGPGRVLMGGMVPLGALTIFATGLVLAPALNEPRQFGRVLAVLLAMATFIGLQVEYALVFVFGESVARLNFPLLSLAREAQVGEFLTNLDALFMVGFSGGGFIQVALLHYVTALGYARLLGLADHRPVSLPLALLLGELSLFIFSDLTELLDFFASTFALAAIAFHVG
ncbi:MAG TPA: GerAB/ArcD/ProY family transporter, partial [Bacillota bacterium]